MTRLAGVLAFASTIVVAPGAASAVAAAAADGSCALEGASGGGEQLAQESLLLQVGTLGARTKPALTQIPLRWRSSGQTSGDGQWCQGFAPASDFSLNKCSADGGVGHPVKILTYNLYWWNLFGSHFRNGNDGSAGKLIASNNANMPYDFMGFQECEDVNRVLQDAHLAGDFASIEGDHAVAIAYRRSEWQLIGNGMDEVAEDRPEQWWGTRGALWARFRHVSNGKTVFFINHHGPLPVGSGGRCGRHATAWNLLRTIATHAEEGDGIVMVGDFNADAGTVTVREVEQRLNRVYTGSSFGGVDHIFSNCAGAHVVDRRNLGNGGSDHDALDVVIKL